MNASHLVDRHVAVVFGALLIGHFAGCATTGPETGSKVTVVPGPVAEVGEPEEFSNTQAALIEKGIHMVDAKDPKNAIRSSFEPVISAYSARYAGTDDLVYSANSTKEIAYYLVKDALDGVLRGDYSVAARQVRVLGPNWGYALFWKGYALGELGDNVGAQDVLQSALRLSPRNPVFLSELGFTYTREGRWIEALSTYEAAEEYVSFALAEKQNEELGRAWRGQAYVLVELGRLDEAEAKYRACLNLDPKDEKARGELGYVLEQKAKAKVKR